MKKIAQIMLIPTTIILLIVVFVVSLYTLNAEKINYGTKIAGQTIGGLSPDEAIDKLSNYFQEITNQNFNLVYQDKIWTINLKNLGINIDVHATVNLAFERGHQSGKLVKNIFWQIKSLLGLNQALAYDIEDAKIEKFFQENLAIIHRPARNSLLVYNKENNDFNISESRFGTIINKDKFRKDIEKNIYHFEAQSIYLDLENDEPTTTEEQAKKLIPRAKELINLAPVTITVNGKKVNEITIEDILELTEPVPELNEHKIENYLVSLAPSVAQEPINAQLTVVDNKATAFSLSQDGIQLEIRNNIEILKNGLLNGDKEIVLKTINTKPEISTENINNLGITSFLAKGVSNFSGSSANRITNIKIGAAKFNGVLIKPNEEFSFNKLLGDVGPEQGYKPGLVIKDNKTIPEYGGGLCQVSTTAFRAAVYSGMEITKRFPHAFPVKYYNPQGFDATIYPPMPDLRFINNTPGHILIQTKIVGNELIFEFYGTNDNRKIEVIGPEQYDLQPDGAMKAKLTQKVYDNNGNVIIDKTFYSNYKSPSLYPEEIINPLQ